MTRSKQQLPFLRRRACGVLLVLGCGLPLAACGASVTTPPSTAPALAGGVSAPPECSRSPYYEESSANALPQYLTLRISGTEVTRGERALSSRELTELIREQSEGEGIAGAAIYLEPDFSGEMLGALVWELSGAGFRHIVVTNSELADAEARSSDANDRAAAAASPGVPTEPAAAPETSEPGPEPPVAAHSDSGAHVVLKPIGLHVGGGPNDDETKALYSAPIERQFDALRACHQFAENPSRKGSVGVDLLVGTNGGRPKVKDYRSAIRGEAFKRCVVDVMSQVRFPAPPRATVISYSVLYKPE